MQSKYDENPEISHKVAMKYARDTMQTQIKTAYLGAYEQEDEDLMARIEDTLAGAGIVYPYRNWLKKIE